MDFLNAIVALSNFVLVSSLLIALHPTKGEAQEGRFTIACQTYSVCQRNKGCRPPEDSWNGLNMPFAEVRGFGVKHTNDGRFIATDGHVAAYFRFARDIELEFRRFKAGSSGSETLFIANDDHPNAATFDVFQMMRTWPENAPRPASDFGKQEHEITENYAKVRCHGKSEKR